MKGYENLFNKIVDNITNRKRHKNYERVVELAKLYKQLATGDGLEELIQQFNRREDDTQHKQRVALTTLVTKCIVNKITTPERKISSTRPLTKEYYYTLEKDTENSVSDKKKRLEAAVKDFYNGKGVDKYVNDVFFTANDLDPNSFILFLFNNYDNRIEQPVIYGYPIPSVNALDFEYINNELDWLIFRADVKYKENGIEKNGDYFSIIAQDEQITFTQIDPASVSGLLENVLKSASGDVLPSQAEDTEDYYYRIKGNTYLVRFASPKCGFTPAIRMGVVRDPVTNGETYLNNWDVAVPYLKKSVKTCSELDLTESLHAFPQAFEYQPRCNGSIESGSVIPCSGGIRPDGKMCSSCNGTGYQQHKSSQDKITLGLPRNPADIFDLEKLKAYISPPIDIFDKLVERLKAHEEGAISSVYNSNRFVKQSFSNTATDALIDYQSVYDAIQPMMELYSDFWTFIIKTIASYNDVSNNLVVSLRFGHRLGIESEIDMINKIQAAKNAQVSSYVIEQMNNDLLYVVYADYPDVLKKVEVKQRFFPFEGKSPNEIAMLISSGNVMRSDVILYSNFKRIFDTIENEVRGFYDMSFKMQADIVSAKVTEIEKQLTPLPEIPFNDGQ